MIAGCIRGDSRMQKAFYYQFYPVMMRICIRYAPNKEDAEQWVQDSFLKTFRNLDKYEAWGSFEGWIRSIVTHVCLDNIRKANTTAFEAEKYTVTTDKIELLADNFSVRNEALQKYSGEEVVRLLKKLPEKQRVVLNLYVYEAYSHKEIAQMLHIKENYSHWLLHQAKKELAMIMNTSHHKSVSHEQ